jgi:hypothetical protein
VQFAKEHVISDDSTRRESGRWRSWRLKCPGDDVLAGYLDGALDNAARTRIELHLADCTPCRSLIGDVAMMQRSDDMPLPLGLKQRAVASTAPRPKRTRWILIPAAAAGFACLLIATVLLREPKNEVGPISTSPGAAVVAKSDIPLPVGQATPNVVRKGLPLEALPILIAPREGSVIELDKPVFRWKPVSRARYYEIHVVTSEGEPVWQGQSNRIGGNLARGATLKNGTYFVWVSAYLVDGRVQRSAPVSFVVNASQ